MIMNSDSRASGKYSGPGTVNNSVIPSQEVIALASKEYALNTILQAEIMRSNRPRINSSYRKKLDIKHGLVGSA